MSPAGPLPEQGMRWASALSTAHHTPTAAEELALELERQLEGGPADLVLLFVDATHTPHAERLAAVLRERLRPSCLIGASARGVIAAEREVETGPAAAAIAARLPGVELRPFLLVNEAWAEAGRDAAAFRQAAPGASGAELVMLLGDPFSFDVERCLTAFDHHAPGSRVVGGMSSAGAKPGANVLLLNDWVSPEGGVALALAGEVRADVIVSQGCRPIGPPLEVTRAQGNFVLELDGVPALERAEQVIQDLVEQEREHLKHGLYVGRPARAGASGQGDYLIRNLLGADRDRGAIAIGDHAVEKERIRLHVRDANSAREDLEMLLSPQAFDSKAEGVLLFTCNGRGRALHGVPNGDVALVESSLGGGVPVAGMFCAGEIGPVGGRNFLHGHTASMAILRGGRPRSD